MRKYRVWLSALAAVAIAVALLPGPAGAWEVAMKGAYTWKYLYATQTDRNGFFGKYDVDARPAADANAHSLNAWLGASANDITVSGADGSACTMFMDIFPEIRINQAVRIRGSYHVGQWWPGANTMPNTEVLDSTAGPSLVQSEYVQYLYSGVRRSFSPGYWNTLWLNAEMPWGILTIGKRPSTFGCAFAWDGDDNRSSETIAIMSNYGPFRIGWGIYASRPGYEGYYNEYFDKSGMRKYDGGPTVTYRSGNIDMGAIANWGPVRHRGPERSKAVAGTGSSSAKGNAETRDRDDWYGGAYAKYNNGRFFFNTEFDWYFRTDKIHDVNAFPYSGVQRLAVHRYIENYRVMAETGLLAGPAKFSVLYAWSNGPDRRGGIRDNINQGVVQDPMSDGTLLTGGLYPRWQPQSVSNTTVFNPYSYLMVYQYGLGAFINADTGKGFMEDASCWGGRLDYAVAANLNLYGTFFYADRVGNGYGWGFLRPAPLTADDGQGAFPGDRPPGTVIPTGTKYTNNVFGQVYQQYKGDPDTSVAGGAYNYDSISPNIPDNALGWEVTAGADWKLLEGLTLLVRGAYWHPGRWFSFACVDKANPAWAASRGATTTTLGRYSNWGTNPSREIDPIAALEIKLVGEF